MLNPTRPASPHRGQSARNNWSWNRLRRTRLTGALTCQPLAEARSALPAGTDACCRGPDSADATGCQGDVEEIYT